MTHTSFHMTQKLGFSSSSPEDCQMWHSMFSSSGPEFPMRHIFFPMTSPSWSCTSRIFILRIRGFETPSHAVVSWSGHHRHCAQGFPIFSYFYRFAERESAFGISQKVAQLLHIRIKALSLVPNRRFPQPFPVSVFFILRQSFMATLFVITSIFTEANLATVPYFSYHTRHSSGILSVKRTWRPFRTLRTIHAIRPDIRILMTHFSRISCTGPYFSLRDKFLLQTLPLQL